MIGMFPMWLVLIPLPGTRPVYALLLALYFDALYSPGDSVAGGSGSLSDDQLIISNAWYFAWLTLLLRVASLEHGRAGPPSAGAVPHPRPRRAQDPYTGNNFVYVRTCALSSGVS